MSGALDLGDLYTKLKVDFSDLAKAEAGARKFSKQADAGFKRVESAGNKIKGVGKVMTGVSVALVGTGLASAKMANTFDKNIAEINSLLPPTERNFKGLKDSVRGVSVALGTDLNEGAAAAYQAISAGVPKDNIVDFLTVSTKAAIAGVTDTATAVDGITTVANAWGASAGDASGIADVMFTAVKNGKTTFEELSRSMFQAAGIAPELGVNFKEVAASVATMTKQGVPTSVAMTQLRASMVSLMNPNSEMTKLLKAAGIESVKASIKQRGLAGTYDVLRKASKKSGISLEKSVGSVEGLGAVLKITGKNAKGFKKDLESMGKSSGGMKSAFEEIDKTRGFDKIVSQFKAIATIIGDALIPVLMPLAQGFANFLTKITELDPGMVQLGVVIGGVMAVLGPLLLAVGGAVLAFAPMVASAGGLGAAFGALVAASGPVGLVIAAVAGGAVLLYKNWDKVTAFFKTAIGGIVSWFQEWVAKNADLISSLSEKWGALVAAGKELWTALYNRIASFVKGSVEWLNKLLKPIGGLQGAWTIFKEVVGAIFTFLGEQLGVVFDVFAKVFKTITEVLNGQKSIWEGFKEIVSTVFMGIVTIITNVGALIWDGVKALWKGVVSVAKEYGPIIWQGVKDIFNKVVTYIKGLAKKFYELGKQILQGLWDGMKEIAGTVVNWVGGIGDAIADKFKGVMEIFSPSRRFKKFGKFIMQGLGIGIIGSSSIATAAAGQAATDTIGAFQKGIDGANIQSTSIGSDFSFSGSGSFGKQEGGDTSFDSGTPDGFPDLDSISAYHDAKIALQLEKGKQELGIVTQLELDKKNAVANAQLTQIASYKGAFSALMGLTKSFAGEQSGVYKAMFAASKAFAIAESIVKIQQGIANAAALPFPANIGAIGSVVAATGSIVSTIQSISMPSAGAFYNGGTISSGKTGIAGEKGVELVGPAGVISTQKTKEMLGGMGKGGGGPVNITVEIVNNNGSDVQVEQSDDGEKLTIIIDRVVQDLTSKVVRGGNNFANSLDQKYKRA